MGLGPTVTLGFVGPDGQWVAVSADNPLPVVAVGSGAPLAIPSETLLPSNELLPSEND
jgi:hypothetical protein